MVEKFKKILGTIVKEKGKITLFAILKMDDLTDRWTVIFSAPWVAESTLKDNFAYLRDLITKEFASDEVNLISRLGIFTKDEHIVQSLLVYKSGSEIKEDVKINGNIIHEGYVLESASNA
ncbi:MAG: hypothetical protein G01um101416_1037 [Microgenomates group bacterium Gr01-1014_16]|nr:MAG: hypothetical protein G01um101416_1037 [Microgenomates group bacterium Gr01-1014_16]